MVKPTKNFDDSTKYSPECIFKIVEKFRIFNIRFWLCLWNFVNYYPYDIFLFSVKTNKVTAFNNLKNEKLNFRIKWKNLPIEGKHILIPHLLVFMRDAQRAKFDEVFD